MFNDTEPLFNDIEPLFNDTEQSFNDTEQIFLADEVSIGFSSGNKYYHSIFQMNQILVVKRFYFYIARLNITGNIIKKRFIRNVWQEYAK